MSIWLTVPALATEVVTVVPADRLAATVSL